MLGGEVHAVESEMQGKSSLHCSKWASVLHNSGHTQSDLIEAAFKHSELTPPLNESSTLRSRGCPCVSPSSPASREVLRPPALCAPRHNMGRTKTRRNFQSATTSPPSNEQTLHCLTYDGVGGFHDSTGAADDDPRSATQGKGRREACLR